jgi:plastocyanin
MKKLLILFWVFLINLISLSSTSLEAFAQNQNLDQSKNEFLVQIKNHKFIPEIIEVSADKPFQLQVENLDNTIEEFESDDLKKEKLVGANKKITLKIQALKAGEYKFYGDFHQKTAQGKIIVK